MKNKIRILTSTSLFDGHDASINIMRRILQDKGVEIIHLGHNRSAIEIAKTAIEEDVHGIALTSYQGGHIEFFSYLKKILNNAQYNHIKIIGGGGGTILPEEVKTLIKKGITKIYLPEDARKLGLEGMIDEVITLCRYDLPIQPKKNKIFNTKLNIPYLSSLITLIENKTSSKIPKPTNKCPVIGITGVGGAGKSSICDEIVRHFTEYNPTKTVAIISIDPTKQQSGGALLGDRIRMNSIYNPLVFMRSLATRNEISAITKNLNAIINACKNTGFDLIIIETAGVGQHDSSIIKFCNIPIYIMTPEYGAPTQLEKINMIDFADIICINKSDKLGSLDAYKDVCKQYKRSHKIFDSDNATLPIFNTNAAQFNDLEILKMYNHLMDLVLHKTSVVFNKQTIHVTALKQTLFNIIPSKRMHYLSEIVDTVNRYNQVAKSQSQLASELYQLHAVLNLKGLKNKENIIQLIKEKESKLTPENLLLIKDWENVQDKYNKPFLAFSVREKKIQLSLHFQTLSETTIQKIYLPKYKDWGDILYWQLQENIPGKFPFTSGVYELKRKNEDPTRMFAGEGCPERTNNRFHYIAQGQTAKRLSTAFDSVTLYGEDPDLREDIYGKIGNAGVNVATINDAKKLYSGFNLCDPSTSVSMTINGPAPIILAFFLNTAIDQACELYITEKKLWGKINKIIEHITHNLKYVFQNNQTKLPEGNNGLGLKLLGISGDQVLPKEIYQEIKMHVLQTVRGTLQADILKEDQAQNTCIFSTQFALKMMGDVQAYFAQNKVRNFYSISISGYHIAEAGANPITQLAFTLANGFTYLEYFLNRNIDLDEFAPNLSFFFSNGMDAEYAVIGRVARRIWAKVLKNKYGANERAQKLKYHIQTSGRSLHAQEIQFNDIRTTLQALYAIYDQCNSLHTNAFDEAITTPTEESVRRALAIQLIINKELGTTKVENTIQGSFLIEELTNIVEEAVMKEFERINERGGVLGAMERMYQRSKIQEESLIYETQKHNGSLPIIGVNQFINNKVADSINIQDVFRSSEFEKKHQINQLLEFKKINKLK
ncbi:MAG: methylmalonyl-CoA mutase family protein, partial [Sediminibacterium sp.]|nr:methylmalonyl-CoA mutase family protein [Sediminibacterium sp.]